MSDFYSGFAEQAYMSQQCSMEQKRRRAREKVKQEQKEKNYINKAIEEIISEESKNE